MALRWMPYGERAALLQRHKRHRDQFTGGREEHRTVQWHRWSISGIARGSCAELEGKATCRLPSGQHMNLVALN